VIKIYIVDVKIENRWQNKGNYNIYELALCKVLLYIDKYDIRLIDKYKDKTIYYKKGVV
jgi:hypothetical protein